MKTISALISRQIMPEQFGSLKYKKEEVKLPYTINGANKAKNYEKEVFNLLLKNKSKLGIKKIIRYENFVIDGVIVLVDDRQVAIEIKFRMNWLKACQTVWQFNTYLREAGEVNEAPVSGAIVFFDDFSGDWARRPQSRTNLNGWNHWYTKAMGYSEIQGLRADLIQIHNQGITSFP